MSVIVMNASCIGDMSGVCYLYFQDSIFIEMIIVKKL